MDFTYCPFQGLQFCAKTFVIFLIWVDRLFVFLTKDGHSKATLTSVTTKAKAVRNYFNRNSCLCFLKTGISVRRKILLLGLHILKVFIPNIFVIYICE